MVYSYLAKREYDIIDVYNPLNWIPETPDTLAIIGSAVAFTLLRVYLQDIFGRVVMRKSNTDFFFLVCRRKKNYREIQVWGVKLEDSIL